MALSHRQDNTYHGLCYTSSGALAGTKNSSMGSPLKIDPTTHRTLLEKDSFILKICILHCLVPLNSVLFKPCLFHLRKIVLSKLCILYCLVPLNSALFNLSVLFLFRFTLERLQSYLS